MRLSRGWAWEAEVEVEEGLQHHLAAAVEAEAAVVGELELLRLVVVERVQLREPVVVAEGMGELVVGELRLTALMVELVVVVECWRQVTEVGAGAHCLSTVVVVLAETKMAVEAAATPVRCSVSWGVAEVAARCLEYFELGEVGVRQNASA